MDKPGLIMSDHIGGISPDMADFLSLGPYVSSPVKDKKVELGIDLNKTPEQKPPPPKRRKHRPKVFVEGKPKRTPKPKGAESVPKRKYVRKTVPEKTCKKALNFDLEKVPDEERSEPESGGKDGSVAVVDDGRAAGLGGCGIAPSAERNFMFINETSNGYISVEPPPPPSSAIDKEISEVNPVELERVKQLMQFAFQPVPATPAKLYEEARGSKRDYSRTVHSLLNGEMRTVGEVQMDKRKKIADEYTRIQSGLPFDVGVAQGGLRKPEKKKTATTSHNINLIAHKLKQTYSAHFSMLDGRFFNGPGTAETGRYEASKFYGSEHCRTIAPRPHFPNQQVSLVPHSHPGNMGSTSAYSPYINFLPVNSARQGQGHMLQTSYAKNHMPATPGIKATSAGASTAKETVPKRRGPKKKNSQLTPIDEIIYRLQNLDLNGGSDRLQGKEQNALVLYNGGGTLVPYQGADSIKKRKPRPKVDLDPETNRIWNLLMGQAVSEDADENDEKKAKWWEDERKVFRGRVDSFIARMHLIQGDRRFSRWKGSVVDSVIGVFLTQNVSDHLSSSAFMCMAARFPLKPGGTQAEARENVIDDEAPIAVINPDDTIKWHEASETTNSQSDTTGAGRGLILSQDSFDSSITKVAGGIRSCSGSNSETEDPYTGLKRRNGQVSALATENSYLVQEVCSENGSTVLNEKCKYGMTEPSLSSSGTTDHPSHLSPTIPNNPGHQCMRQPCPCGNNSLTTSKVSELWLRELFSEESTSSWQSPASVSAKGPEAVSESSRRGEVAGSSGNFSMEQLGLWGSQEESTPTGHHSNFSTDLTNQQGIPETDPDPVYNQFCIEYLREWNKMFGMDSVSSTEPVKQAEALNKKQNETMTIVNNHAENIANDGDCSSAVNTQASGENKLVEANSKEQITPSEHASKVAKPKSTRTRNGNSESNKKKAIDWDDLRKKVEGNATKKERPKGAMDSLDYEAVRTANVSEISETIKERGMNNMLAERMKEFLNRVVKDHGSIDLEWLRDVPPDKAKDYLLSIRGLGLKSVECVRLLSLHHLAFPVDTNVGRIAVRLGWVPLQPLPESLQLHLLELYPILETIQKYLWPRLCKLDQLTLYELHYQMITFGKVFCTKSKPNCNACPMRGECRHFASAFASARLALPAPEDKSIVSSTISPTADNTPGVVIHPMALPPPEQGSIIEVGSNTRCEPIIEEPATPEPERIDISESDIEDYEDPNEIPTIKLSMPEFTKNLQDYMQNNMELQEADMSKALVALSPYMASIPIPKLKNISRLRTEHRVYELPDSHPLLERFERREPDDPSPYLLAIWTPGETANSVQPSERSCGCEADKLCSDVTCFSCNSARETNSQTVRGTILIPCRTAMRGSFPLNGTYFQVNEMFADHESSLDPINVPREWIWNLPRRTVYFGTSVSTIFKGLTTEGIQYCFWKGFVCVRGFDTATRAPRPLKARLHFPASKLVKTKKDEKK